jgi:hypothetical protein
MEHAEAIESHTAERYLLDELTAAEADSFEEHYFDCHQCAEDLRDGMAMLDGGRNLAREWSDKRPRLSPAEKPATVLPGPGRFRWLPAAAAAVLILGLSGALLMRRGNDVPSFEVMQEAPAYLAVSRNAQNIVILGEKQSVIRFVDVPATENPYARYELRLLAPDGTVLGSSTISSQQAMDSVPVVLRDLAPGTHEIVIESVDGGGQRSRLTAIPFTIRRP